MGVDKPLSLLDSLHRDHRDRTDEDTRLRSSNRAYRVNFTFLLFLTVSSVFSITTMELFPANMKAILDQGFDRPKWTLVTRESFSALMLIVLF